MLRPRERVDAHNVVPVWYASDKLEYAARTIRRKLHDRWNELMTEFPPVVTHPFVPINGPVKRPVSYFVVIDDTVPVCAVAL
ncbi:unnamed protein product [Echinostoma caproni]|uniref:Reverse transcriptase n=1 Tax=Echinostoma caproni TaxID=27848 RepID=A0A183A0W9_9TREM|nr:unnamed protein product [Echinostoma caproni]